MNAVAGKFGGRVGERYKVMSDFEVLLEDARMAASSDFEEEFVAQTKENYNQFKAKMFWSEKQDQLLRRIAGPEDY